jgi:hypothetical protein
LVAAGQQVQMATNSKIIRILLLIQGVYTTLTALWGLIDIHSFMVVTGPKTDIWLVKTVSAILVCVGLTLLTNLRSGENLAPRAMLSVSSAVALSCIDFYYAEAGIIRRIYELDGIMQLLFLLTWGVVMARKLLKTGA